MSNNELDKQYTDDNKVGSGKACDLHRQSLGQQSCHSQDPSSACEEKIKEYLGDEDKMQGVPLKSDLIQKIIDYYHNQPENNESVNDKIKELLSAIDALNRYRDLDSKGQLQLMNKQERQKEMCLYFTATTSLENCISFFRDLPTLFVEEEEEDTTIETLLYEGKAEKDIEFLFKHNFIEYDDARTIEKAYKIAAVPKTSIERNLLQVVDSLHRSIELYKNHENNKQNTSIDEQLIKTTIDLLLKSSINDIYNKHFQSKKSVSTKSDVNADNNTNENDNEDIFHIQNMADNQNGNGNENELEVDPNTNGSDVEDSFHLSSDNDDDENIIGEPTKMNQSIAQYNAYRQQLKKREKAKLEDKEMQFNEKATKLFKPITEQAQRDTMMAELFKKPVKVVGKRKDRNIDEQMKKMKEQFDNLNIGSAGDATYYKKNFLDMIINGNFRVKYIPNAATRDLAEKYCRKHVDENGKPRYRLLPVNAKDPNDVDITDLNGDQVDDIVLVDKRGIPQIINGYKLVYASPYKKAWKAIMNTREKRIKSPFNVWLAEQFNKNIQNVDWGKGEYKLEPNATIGFYMDKYQAKGLGKPRISRRLTPNSYWSSVFTHVWKLFWNVLHHDLKPITKLLNYLSIANAMFVINFDIKAKKGTEKSEGKVLSYPAWLSWKNENKAKYNNTVGPVVVECAQNVINEVVDIKTGNIKVAKLDKNNNAEFLKLITRMDTLIFDEILGLGEKWNEQHVKGVIEAQVYNVPPDELKEIRAYYNKRLTLFLDKLYGGKSRYSEYKDQYKANKDALYQNIEDYDIKFKNA